MLRLRYDTPREWIRAVLEDFDSFLQDHAANERKASASALAIAVHYPDRADLVAAMVELAREEFLHFTEVYGILTQRNRTLGRDAPDPYMREMRRLIRTDREDEYFLDRLLVFGTVEARGCQRFTVLSEAMEDGFLKEFYARLARSEGGHHGLFVRLAKRYCDADQVRQRLDQILDAEADIAGRLPLRPAVH